MTTLERNILKKISTELKNSHKTEWKSGDLQDWTSLGKKMMAVINNSVAILDTLTSETENPIKE